MELTPYQRSILVNQYRILEILNPDFHDEYKKARTVFENGFELDYDEHFFTEDHFSINPVPIEICNEVIDILQMHRLLLASYDKLSKDDKKDISPDLIKFAGFDGSSASHHLRYAEFVINIEHRFQESSLPDLNSHCILLPLQRKMVEVWKNSKNPRRLTKEDIRRVIKLYEEDV